MVEEIEGGQSTYKPPTLLESNPTVNQSETRLSPKHTEVT